MANVGNPVVVGAETLGSDGVRALFDRLMDEWKAATATTSSLRDVLMHPAHLQIIGMGQAALPFIFIDLRRGGGPWFLALNSITRANPVEPSHRSDAKAIRRDWLRWGSDHGYLQSEPGV